MSSHQRFEAEDRALFERLVVALEGRLKAEAAPKGRWPQFWDRYGTAATVLVSAVALGGTVFYSQRQLSQSSDQFDRTIRQSQYSDIVNGMASSSVAVQVNSIRRLVQYVANTKNFEDTEEQSQAADNAAHTLAAFIEDESSHPGHEGLTSYRDPQPTVVLPAVNQLIQLTGLRKEGHEGPSFQVNVDLSRGNFHGAPAGDYVPEGSFLARAADFRAATVTGWDLTAVAKPILADSFFTCANLQTSKFGSADVGGADFTGANLRGADLSHVRNLTSAQVRGALTGDKTVLPHGVTVRHDGWGIDRFGDQYRPSVACRHLLDKMTNLLPASGFSERLACPGPTRSPFSVQLSQRENAALERVCRIRSTLRQPAGKDDSGSRE